MSEDLAFGYTRFNHIVQAFVTIFQCITEEGWTDVMYQLMDAHTPIAAAIYFNLLILVGSFFCLNLTLAVIWNEFSKAEEAAEAVVNRAKMTRVEFGAVDEEEGDDEIMADVVNDGEDKRLSYFCCGKVGTHEDSQVGLMRQCYKLVNSGGFEAFIV